MVVEVNKVLHNKIASIYALMKVRYHSVAMALNFVFHHDDSGFYEHPFIGSFEQRVYEHAEAVTDPESLQKTMAFAE